MSKLEEIKQGLNTMYCMSCENSHGDSVAWLIEELERAKQEAKDYREALKLYAAYDNETVQHMDTEFLPPQRVAVVKPLESIGKGYAPDGKHPSEIHQDNVFTYGPKQSRGKIAREVLSKHREGQKDE